MTFMLDTNIFNAVLDGRILTESLAGRELLTTGVQLGELKATRDASRQKALLETFINVGARSIPGTSFAFDVEGAGWDEAEWNDGTDTFQRMLARLNELEKKRDGLNPVKDIIIAETAIKRGAILVSNDRYLCRVVNEFGGTAIDFEAFLASPPA